MREEYTIKLRRPEGVSIKQMERYIKESVLNGAWGMEGSVFQGVWKERGRNTIHVKKK